MNDFSPDEVCHLLMAAGATHVSPYHGGFRSECMIHGGDNPRSLAVWLSRDGDFRATCHSHHCVTAASIEWVVAKALSLTIRDAIAWISSQLGRTDLSIPSVVRTDELQCPETVSEDIQLYDLAMLTRLHTMYPYADYWKQRGYPEELVRAYQLTYRSLDHRAVIPVFDETSNLVGVVSRATLEDDPVKYRWESPNSCKTRWLYGIPQAFQHPLSLQGRRTVILVEGTLDIVKLGYCGFPAVSAQTNALSTSQADQLIANWDLIILVPDQDEAGKCLISDVQELCAPFVDLAVVTLPEGHKDPDTFSIDEIEPLFNNVISMWSNKWQNANRFQRSRVMTLNLNQLA